MPSTTIQTPLPAAGLVARAVEPDNTAEMTTTVIDTDGDTPYTKAVKTTITRDSTGGLRATATDYIANLDVATQIVQTVDQHAIHQS